MYKVFIDTNVILEHALMRAYYKDVIELFKFAEDRKISCFCSAPSFYTLSYILRKKYSGNETKDILKKYLELMSIIATNQSHLSLSLSSAFKDLEDAFQYHTAFGNANYFITFNKKDFAPYATNMEICTPAEFLQLFASRE